MDKTTAEKTVPENVMRMVDAIIAWPELYAGFGLELANWVKALTTPEPATKPQGEASDSDLHKFGYAPGHYCSKCHRCDSMYHDLDKRAICCRTCAIEAFKAALVPPEATPSKPAEPLHDAPLFNRYGVDADYFRCELRKLSESLESRPADELSRYLRNLADTAQKATPTDQLLEAAKAVLEWYGPLEADCMVALSKEVKAREKVKE